MCLGELGVVADVLDDGRALVRFDDGSYGQASLVVPAVEGTGILTGDRVMVSMGMVLRREGEA